MATAGSSNPRDIPKTPPLGRFSVGGEGRRSSFRERPSRQESIISTAATMRVLNVLRHWVSKHSQVSTSDLYSNTNDISYSLSLLHMHYKKILDQHNPHPNMANRRTSRRTCGWRPSRSSSWTIWCAARPSCQLNTRPPRSYSGYSPRRSQPIREWIWTLSSPRPPWVIKPHTQPSMGIIRLSAWLPWHRVIQLLVMGLANRSNYSSAY